MTVLRVIDFETTGLPPEADVIEAAMVDVTVQGGRDVVRTDALGWVSYMKTDRPIEVTARAAHHIPQVALAGGVTWDFAREWLNTCHDEQLIFVAHYADFEQQFFKPQGRQWIDTYKVALRLWPDAPRHSNQVLRYWLDCDPGPRGMPPHRALPDCHVTSEILLCMLKQAPIEKMIEWTQEPPYRTKLHFGKHNGKRYEDCPRDYLEWILRTGGFDAGVAEAARRALG